MLKFPKSIIYRIRPVVALRKIMNSASLCEKALEELEKNPYFEKYAKKIATLQETSPEEFLSRVEYREKRKTEKKDQTQERNYSALMNPKKPEIPKIEDKNDSLEKIMKVELLQDKNAEEIKEIWLKFHMDKDVIAATIPAADYDKLHEKTLEFPTFLLALPRSQGYEFIMLQYEGNSAHLTPLLYYQVHKENAPECLTITHYTELKDTKGIVLMRGAFDKNVISAQEAQCLANQIQLYYIQDDPNKNKLLEIFSKKPDEFKHMDLIKQIENLTL